MNSIIGILASILIAQPMTMHEYFLVQEINDYRMERGLPPFQQCQKLMEQARKCVEEYPARIESYSLPINVNHGRGYQHCISIKDYYPAYVEDEANWMYSPTFRAIMDGYRTTPGFATSQSHQYVLEFDAPHIGVAVFIGYVETPRTIPVRTGPFMVSVLVGDCND